MKKASQHKLLYLLSALLLLQGLFPTLTHTQLVRDSHGELVAVCTIDGIRHIQIDFGQSLDDQQIEDNQRTPAILLSELMSAATTTIFTLTPPESDHISTDFPDRQQTWHALIAPGYGHIRAPPLA